jgi:hypothetical protein
MRAKSFTAPWACHCCSQSASRSATSRAVWNRSAGSLACNLATIRHSHSGTSGMISRIGRGSSSHTRLSTAIVPLARNGGRPLAIT